MTPEAQRIAIAGACGHKDLAWRVIAEGTGMDQIILCSGVIGRGGYGIPYFYSDLNACHKMEKVLTDEFGGDQYGRYCVKLNEIACRVECGNVHTCGYTICATAPQRCEAFLRTLGLWTADRAASSPNPEVSRGA